MYKIREISTGNFLNKPFIGKFSKEGFAFDFLENAKDKRDTLINYRHMPENNLEIVKFNLNEVGVVKN